MPHVPETITDLFLAYGAFFLVFLFYAVSLRREQRKIIAEIRKADDQPLR